MPPIAQGRTLHRVAVIIDHAVNCFKLEQFDFELLCSRLEGVLELIILLRISISALVAIVKNITHKEKVCYEHPYL